jgi:hypothetical protein
MEPSFKIRAYEGAVDPFDDDRLAFPLPSLILDSIAWATRQKGGAGLSALVPDMEYRSASRSECRKQFRDAPNGVWIVTALACRLPFVEGTLHINHDQRRARVWKFIHTGIITKGQRRGGQRAGSA